METPRPACLNAFLGYCCESRFHPLRCHLSRALSYSTSCDNAVEANDRRHLLKKAVDGEVAVLFTADIVAIELRPEALMGFQQDHKKATILCMITSAQDSLKKCN